MSGDTLLAVYAIFVGLLLVGLGWYVLRHLDILQRLPIFRPPGMTDRGIALLLLTVGGFFVLIGAFVAVNTSWRR